MLGCGKRLPWHKRQHCIFDALNALPIKYQIASMKPAAFETGKLNVYKAVVAGWEAL